MISCHGHLHIDDFFILKKHKIPVASALISPSLSPLFNPTYRIYEFDNANGSLVDYNQFYAPLKDEQLNFARDYNCQESFGNGPLTLEYFINLKNRDSLEYFFDFIG